MRDTMSLTLTALALLVSGCGISENPDYCEDHASCAGNPAGSFCHPAKHYCYAGCSSDQECQNPSSGAYQGAGKPVCGLTSRVCEVPGLTLPPAPDGGPAVDGRPAPAADLASSPDGSKKQRGASCAAATECDSGFCAAGVCCDGACDGTCVACNLSGTAGTCAPVPAGEDPRKECAGSGACTGSCDGKGACSFAATASKSCASPACATGSLTVSACDAKGACVAAQQSCGGYACVGATSCKASCASTADCTGAFQCVASKCVAQLPLGASCGNNPDACASKHCTDGACCKLASCGGPCKQCGAGGECLAANEGGSCGAPSCSGNAASGAQQTVPTCKAGGCASTTSSCGDFLCDAAGTSCLGACGSDSQCKATAYCGGAKCLPKKQLGSTCSASKECQAGACVDGVCCNGACGSTCMSCKLAGKIGQCSPIPDGQNPDAECAGTVAACSGTCDGQGACKYPGATTSCKAPNCTGSMLSQAFCYKGGCIDYGTTCTGDYTCASATACATSCTTNAQCMSGACDLHDLFPGKKNTCAKVVDVCYADAKTCPQKGAGTATSPFCKIQDCLDTTKPYVLVADGKYGENLVVKAEVQLLALGSSAPLVDHRTGAVNSAAIKVELVPPGSGKAGISVVDSGKVLLRGLRVTHHGASASATGDLVSVAKTLGAPSMEVRIESCDLWEAHGAMSNALSAWSGGGMPLTVSLIDSTATWSPRGVTLQSASAGSATQLELKKVVLVGNADHALAVGSSSAKVLDAFIAFNAGFGIHGDHCDLTVERAKIGANGGVGVYLDRAQAVIANSLVNDNGAEGIRITGSGTLLSGPNLRLVNVTATNNKNAELACPSWTSGTGQVLVENSILHGYSNPIVNTLACIFTVNHSAVKNMGGGSNLSADPKFVGGTGDGYQLQPGSPCLDAGSDAQVSGSLDVLGNPRIVNKLGGAQKVDLGAYERP